MTAKNLAAAGTAARSQRARLKERIGAGEIDAVALLRGDVAEDVEAIAMQITVVSILRAVPGIGPATMMEVIRGRAVFSHTRLADLTTRQRRQIADHLEKEIRR